MATSGLLQEALDLGFPVGQLGALMQFSGYYPQDWSNTKIIRAIQQGVPHSGYTASYDDATNTWMQNGQPFSPPAQDPGWGPTTGSTTPGGIGGGTTPGPVPPPTPNPTPNPLPTPTPTPTPTPNPFPGGGGGGSGGGGGGTVLPGYGVSQTLNGFGIPGFETNPMVGGGSWQGTQWNGAPYSSYTDPVIPNSDPTNPGSPYYRGPVTNPDGTPIAPGLSIKPAVPYQTSWYLGTYNGKRAPWENIHQQTGDALRGIPAAKPGFNWASPQALSGLGGYGLPGGWTSMLGFAPGGSK